MIVRTNRRTSRLDACFSDRCLVLKHRTGISFTLSLGLSWIPCRWTRSPKGLACSSFTGCYPQISRNRHPDREYMPHSNVYPNMPHQHCAWGQFLRLHTQFAVVKCSCYLSFSHCLVFRCPFYPHSSYVVNYPFSMIFYCKSIHFHHKSISSPAILKVCPASQRPGAGTWLPATDRGAANRQRGRLQQVQDRLGERHPGAQPRWFSHILTRDH